MFIKTIVVVVGISHYLQKEIAVLPAAENDAVNFARSLRNWGISDENILLILNEEASFEKLDKLFGSLTDIQEDYKFVFYFCGHGHRISSAFPQSYLIFYDSVIKDNECINSYNLDYFAERIAKLNALESYIFIDACSLRINHFINPNYMQELNGNLNAKKGLICILSSGVEKSFECIKGAYGYFTKALLNSLRYQGKFEESPSQLLQNIQNELMIENIPLPEMLNFGNQRISFLLDNEFPIDDKCEINRSRFIAEIQDAFIQNPQKIITLCGESGSGKTRICHHIESEKTKTIYFTFLTENIDPINFIEYQIYNKYGCDIDEFAKKFPYALIIFDQLERLDLKQLKQLLIKIENLNIKCLCVSTKPFTDFESTFDLYLPPLSLKEAVSFIKRINENYSVEDAELIYLFNKGNILKIENFIKLNQALPYIDLFELKKAIAAIYGCSIYHDTSLFREVFNIQENVITFLEKNDLIIKYENSFVPHPLLEEFADYKNLSVKSEQVLRYWHEQAKSQPSDPQIAKSLILTIKCFGYEKKYESILRKSFNCLALTEDNFQYFLDGAEIYSSLSYKTSTTLYLAKVLASFGKDDLATKLLNIAKAKTFHWFSFSILTFFFLILLLAFWQDLKPLNSNNIVYVKQTHPDFVGRENYLKSLQDSLIVKHIEGKIPVEVLSGEEGVGKSEIAIAFANHHLNHFSLVHVMDMATEESLLASYQHLALQLKIPYDQQESIDKVVRKVHDKLENDSELIWLLIYDNAEKIFELPQRGNGAIIVTTRDHTIWHLFPHQIIKRFTEKEALLLIKKITQNKESLNQIKLIQELENHPLSLNMASHYIKETPNMSEESYIELLKQDRVNLLDNMPKDQRYPKGLLNSWQMTSNQLYKNHPKALQWLHFCSYLYPDDIPIYLLEDWLKQLLGTEVSSYTLKMQTNEILRLMINRSHMNYGKDNQTLSLHRLKQEIFKHDEYFNDSVKEEVLKFLVYPFEKFERYDEMERNPKIWSKLRDWELHATWFLAKYGESSSREEIALLNNLLGSWKANKGEYQLATDYFEKALKMRLELFGESDLRTITAMNNKAWILMRFNKLEESKTLFHQALNALKKIDNNHSHIPFLINNLSHVYMSLGDFESLRIINEKILKRRIETLGIKDGYTADSMNNVAIAYWKMKEYDQSIHYFEQAIEIYKSFYGENHSYVAISKYYLARTLLSKGEYYKAEKYFIQTIDMYNKLYGKEHPYFLRCMQRFGYIQENLGREDKAFAIYQNVYSGYSEIFDNEHPYRKSILEDIIRLLHKASLKEYLSNL